MIKFLKNWVQQIVVATIIVSIFELILPEGNLKKYVKVILIADRKEAMKKLDLLEMLYFA